MADPIPLKEAFDLYREIQHQVTHRANLDWIPDELRQTTVVAMQAWLKHHNKSTETCFGPMDTVRRFSEVAPPFIQRRLSGCYHEALELSLARYDGNDLPDRCTLEARIKGCTLRLGTALEIMANKLVASTPI